jgi:hypothetical protein
VRLALADGGILTLIVHPEGRLELTDGLRRFGGEIRTR